MSELTLAEHAAELAAEESAEETNDTQIVDEYVEEKATIEVEEETEDLAKSEDDETTEVEQESWMQSEANDSQGDDLSDVPDAVWAAVRKGAKAKADRKEESHQNELAEMQAQIDKLSQGTAQQPVSTGRPKREDFYHLDNDEEAYEDAVFEWRTAANDAKTKAATLQKSKDDFKASQDKALDNHYSRAEGLSKAGITANDYKQSDLTVRNLLGNDLVNNLISDTGEGSEKVFYSLGRNPTQLNKLKSLMETDPRGVQALMFIGELKAGLKTPTKRTSLAPAPAATPTGDAGKGSAKSAKAAFAKAEKSGDVSKAFNLKRKYKQAGHDTSNW